MIKIPVSQDTGIFLYFRKNKILHSETLFALDGLAVEVRYLYNESGHHSNYVLLFQWVGISEPPLICTNAVIKFSGSHQKILLAKYYCSYCTPLTSSSWISFKHSSRTGLNVPHYPLSIISIAFSWVYAFLYTRSLTNAS